MRTVFYSLAACVLGLLAASLASAGAYSDAVLNTPGLVAYYQMTSTPAEIGDPLLNTANPGNIEGLWGFEDGNEDTLPMSGVEGPNPDNGYTGLDVGNTAAFGGNGADDDDNGQPGDNVSDQMDLGTYPEFDNRFATVSFFMKTTGGGNDSRMFTTEPGATYPFRVIWGTNRNPTELTVVTGAPFSFKRSQQTLQTLLNNDMWYNVVVVRDNDNNGTVYVEGIKVDMEGDDFENFSESDSSTRIGARSGTSNPGWGAFTGDMDDFAYWNRALTDSEIVALAKASGAPYSGDMDLSGLVDFDDIAPFVAALNDPVAYLATFGTPARYRGDTDFNGVFDFDDIAGFVDVLSGGAIAGAVVPEPSTFLLLLVAGAWLVSWRRCRR